MPRRVVAARERTGMVRLEGYGKMDDRGTCQLAAGGKDRGRQNFRLSDAQFEHLIETIELRALPGSEAPFRAELDRIREFVLKDCLQKDQEPSRAEVHHALTVLRSRTENFLERATAIRRWPDWFVRPAPFGSSASSVFSSFPEILLDLATQARHDANISERAACDFRAFAETSEELRYELKSLDSVSQGKNS